MTAYCAPEAKSAVYDCFVLPLCEAVTTDLLNTVAHTVCMQSRSVCYDNTSRPNKYNKSSRSRNISAPYLATGYVADHSELCVNKRRPLFYRHCRLTLPNYMLHVEPAVRRILPGRS